MLKSFRVRLVVILAALGLSIGYYVTRGLKLGLDLQGGMHLVLEIDDPDETLTPEARARAIERAERIIRTRVDEFGVEEPLIQRIGAERIIVELAGLDDESRAKEIINQQAYLEWKLVLPTTEVHQSLARLDRANRRRPWTGGSGGDGKGPPSSRRPPPRSSSFSSATRPTRPRPETP